MTEWLTAAEYGQRIGLSAEGVRSRGRRGTLIRKLINRQWHYLWEGDEVEEAREAEEDGPDDGADVVMECLDDESGTPDYVRRDHYVYDGQRDQYILSLDSHPGVFVMAGARLRSLWRSYTTGATIAEITRNFAMDRQMFMDLKKALHLTHTRAPFTDEELASRTQADLTEDALRLKERTVLRNADRESWRRIKADASRWRMFQASILDNLGELTMPPPQPISRPASPATGKHLVVLGTTDLHIGKRQHGAVGDNQAYVRQLLNLTADAVTEALRWGTPEQWVVFIGSDLTNADNWNHTTTRGTHQGPSNVGSVFEHFDLAWQYMATVIDLLREYGSVLGAWIPGNHDEYTSYTIAALLKQRYINDPNVVIDIDRDVYKVYNFWDEVPVMLCHGHRPKRKLYPMLLAQKSRGADLGKGVVLQGHHHRWAQEDGDKSGVAVVTMSSPAADSEWDHGNGYDVGRKRMSLVRLTPAEGLKSIHWVTLTE